MLLVGGGERCYHCRTLPHAQPPLLLDPTGVVMRRPRGHDEEEEEEEGEVREDRDNPAAAMDEQDNEAEEEEGEMDVSEAAAGLVQAALSITPPQVLLPGDVNEVPEHLSRVKLGNGLISAPSPPGAAKATKAGILRFQPPNTYRIDNQQRRYIPKGDDTVIGIVEDRGAEHYRVNIFGSTPGLLPHLAFDGASKRNKPNLKVGALVYCRVAVANKDMDSELSCMVTQGIKKDWMTGESTFGELKDGTVTRCSLGLCRQLLNKDCRVLQALAKQQVPFEVAVGRNGAFYVNAEDPRIIVAVVNILLNSEMIHEGHDAMVRSVLAAVSNKRKAKRPAS